MLVIDVYMSGNFAGDTGVENKVYMLLYIHVNYGVLLVREVKILNC